MTPEEKQKLDEICRRVIAEKDPQKFSELVEEMNRLLEKKEERIVPTKAKAK